MIPAMINVAIPAITIAYAFLALAAAVQLVVIPIYVGFPPAILMTAIHIPVIPVCVHIITLFTMQDLVVMEVQPPVPI